MTDVLGQNIQTSVFNKRLRSISWSNFFNLYWKEELLNDVYVAQKREHYYRQAFNFQICWTVLQYADLSDRRGSRSKFVFNS